MSFTTFNMQETTLVGEFMSASQETSILKFQIDWKEFFQRVKRVSYFTV